MQKVIIIYDENYDDCDIISVPDYIAKDIEKYGQTFCDWLLTTDDEYYYVYKNGRKYLNCETIGFLKWLNQFVCHKGLKAVLEEQHIQYRKGYPLLEF